jgi:hypothetical protein
MFETMKEEDLIRMVVTLWAIWHAKQKAVHEEFFHSPLTIVGFVNRFIGDLEHTRLEPKTRVLNACPSWSMVLWTAPPVGKAKLNVDAAVAKSSTKGEVGTVCRDGKGNFLGATVVVFDGITSPGTLEALACREGLDATDNLRIGQVHAAMDCLEVVKGLQDGSNILMEIRVWMTQRGGTTFEHE